MRSRENQIELVTPPAECRIGEFLKRRFGERFGERFGDLADAREGDGAEANLVAEDRVGETRRLVEAMDLEGETETSSASSSISLI